MQTLEHNSVESLYEDTIRETKTEEFYYPHVMTLERDDYYTILVELPGVKKKNIHISVGDYSITIEARRHDKISYIYERRFPIKGDVVTGEITTRIDDGLVSVRLPKKVVELSSRQKRKQKFPEV